MAGRRSRIVGGRKSESLVGSQVASRRIDWVARQPNIREDKKSGGPKGQALLYKYFLRELVKDIFFGTRAEYIVLPGFYNLSMNTSILKNPFVDLVLTYV